MGNDNIPVWKFNKEIGDVSLEDRIMKGVYSISYLAKADKEQLNRIESKLDNFLNNHANLK